MGNLDAGLRSLDLTKTLENAEHRPSGRTSSITNLAPNNNSRTSVVRFRDDCDRRSRGVANRRARQGRRGAATVVMLESAARVVARALDRDIG
jgi:hypothetical protein